LTSDRGKGVRVDSNRGIVVAWVGSQILPHEADVRRWLRRAGATPPDIDDIVQEAYCRLAGLATVAHIQNGRAYFFQTVRSIAIERIRRSRVVRIDSVPEIDALSIVDSEPLPERIVASRRELQRVQALIDGLPDRCRQIFTLRRIQGMPQRDIARLLGVTENVVEMQAMRGLRLILQALTEGEDPERLPNLGPQRHERRPKRMRDR
jgi:RNA polymerase sigma-70 factor (ECF subfamily)